MSESNDSHTHLNRVCFLGDTYLPLFGHKTLGAWGWGQEKETVFSFSLKVVSIGWDTDTDLGITELFLEPDTLGYEF